MEIAKQRNRLEGAERWLSLLGGSAAVYYGLKRKSFIGKMIALGGLKYAARGFTGERDVLDYLGFKSTNGMPYGRGIKLRRSVTIRRTPEELYRFWRRFENLPRFFRHIESVVDLGGQRSHWIMKAGGTLVEWDAEITADRPNELIGWRATNGRVQHAGSVRFEEAHGGRGTVVRVQLQYNQPGGRIAHLLAQAVGQSPDQLIAEDLTRLKELMEVGEIPTTEGQPSGRAPVAAQSAPAIEEVEEASIESFPASDAPSWTASGGQRRAG